MEESINRKLKKSMEELQKYNRSVHNELITIHNNELIKYFTESMKNNTICTRRKAEIC